MYSRKQLTLLALLGVAAIVNGRQMRNSQIKSQMKQDTSYSPLRQIWSEEASEPVASYREAEHSASRPSASHHEEEREAAPHCDSVVERSASEPVRYEDTFTAFFNPPSVPVFSYNEETERYESSPTLLTGTNYFYYEQSTRSYEPYEPTPAQWTEYYEEPTVPLYYYEEATHEFTPIAEPSPHLSYYYQVPSTQTYFKYEPTPVEWTNTYYEP
jgi:hypothetical protein